MRLAPLRIRPHFVWVFVTRFALLVPLALGLGSLTAHAQVSTPTAAKSKPAKSPSADVSTKPAWSELTPAQQVALSPLASAWNGINEAQKRKWIAMSQNYPGLSAAERTTLHGRMTEWATLSPAQRNQARLNFAQTKQLSTEEKKTQWQAYQALSPEQKSQLASRAQPKAPGAAPALTLVSPNKLAAVPITRSEAHSPSSAASGTRAGQGASGHNMAGAAPTPVTQP